MRKPDTDIFRLPLGITQAPTGQVLYLENASLFVELAKALGIRSILHTDYQSTCAKLASFGFQTKGIRETN